MIDACLNNDVEKLIYVSSVSAYAPPLSSVVNENAKLGGSDNYGRSKVRAEYLIQESPVKSIIIRPCQVYGEGDRSNFTANLLKLIKLPILPIASGQDNRFSLVHVDDLADALISAMETSCSKGRVYNIAGSETTSLEELAKLYCTLSGHRQLRIRIPKLLIRFLLAIRWFVINSHREQRLVPLRFYAKHELYGSMLLGGPKYDISNAQEEFGYRPTISTEAGLLGLITNEKYLNRKNFIS
jgi:nucleoside-diphosphate-sugar epimerase